MVERVCVLPQLITRFMKSMYTDKIIILFVCLVFVAIAGIIAYSTLVKHSAFSPPDVPAAPSPAPK